MPTEFYFHTRFVTLPNFKVVITDHILRWNFSKHNVRPIHTKEDFVLKHLVNFCVRESVTNTFLCLFYDVSLTDLRKDIKFACAPRWNDCIFISCVMSVCSDPVISMLTDMFQLHNYRENVHAYLCLDCEWGLLKLLMLVVLCGAEWCPAWCFWSRNKGFGISML